MQKLYIQNEDHRNFNQRMYPLQRKIINSLVVIKLRNLISGALVFKEIKSIYADYF